MICGAIVVEEVRVAARERLRDRRRRSRRAAGSRGDRAARRRTTTETAPRRRAAAAPTPSSFAIATSMLDAGGRPPARWRPVAENAVPSGWLTVFIASPLTIVRRSRRSYRSPMPGPEHAARRRSASRISNVSCRRRAASLFQWRERRDVGVVGRRRLDEALALVARIGPQRDVPAAGGVDEDEELDRRRVRRGGPQRPAERERARAPPPSSCNIARRAASVELRFGMLDERGCTPRPTRSRRR